MLLSPSTVHADVNNFVITKFSADETLSRVDRQGTLRVIERIDVQFSDYNHGILRAIPTTYHGLPLKIRINGVSSDSGASAAYTTYGSNGNMVLKIGDKNRVVTGAQEYTIDYTLQNVVAFFDNDDELYWDVNGDQWAQPVDSVTAVVHLPGDVKLSSQKPVCYANAAIRDSTSCSISRSGNDITVHAGRLGAGQTLTYVIGFQKGYFSPATSLDFLRDYSTLLLLVLGIPLLSFAVGLVWWWARGRDAPGKGTIVPQYTPPENMLPLEAGALADFSVDNRDITATFIDLARRKYIKIIEKRQDRPILKDKITYSLELLNPDASALSVYERTLLSGVFKSGKLDPADKGQVVELSSLAKDFYKTADSLRKAVSKDMTTAGYFRQDPRRYLFKLGGVFTIMYVGAFTFGFIAQMHMIPAAAGIIMGVIVLFLFARIIPARTSMGVAAREQLMGLKMYMETAEKDRLKMLEGPNAAYAANVGAPVRTVELFEKLLPFAIVLGVEKEWAGQFKDIYQTPPDWYNGNMTGFNAGYLAGSLNGGFASAVNTSFSAPSSSGGSGFGGGGFSGGGGGGGGGGGW